MARTAPVPNIPAIPGMNPGMFVAGGGAGGSGSGDGAGDGSGGDPNANGNGDPNDPNGGGNGAGHCGQGGAGACTNCGHNTSAGDPVEMATGTVFTLPKRELFLPGLFDLDFQRSYSTNNRDVDLGMGFGWSHTFGWRLEEHGEFTTLRTDHGTRVDLTRCETVGEARSGTWAVFRDGDHHVVRPGNEFIHYFSRVQSKPDLHRLDFIRYRQRGRIALEYDGTRLARAIDTVGRVIEFEGTREGRIASISVHDPATRTIVFARYLYDPEGNLVSATDADGNVTRYAYDDQHRLTRHEYPNGLAFHYVYDRAGRCIETWGAYPDGRDPALSPDVPNVLRDGKKAKGIFHCRLTFGKDYTEVADSVRIRRVFNGPMNKIRKAVDARGGVTTRTFDERGSMTSQTDPTGATWTYQHDHLGLVVAETDAEGATTKIERDVAGRPMRMVDPEGGVTTIKRSPSGEVTEIQDPAGGMQLFTHDDRGRVTQIIDERGGHHLFEYDQHGNNVAYTSPVGATKRFTYDYWGRTTSVTDALGHTRRYEYADSGRITTIWDALGRRYGLEYNAMGLRSRETRPDGTSREYRYGGLNWFHTMVNWDGTEVRALFNREGWTVTTFNERGERFDIEYAPTGLASKTRDFLGRETRYGRDALGRIVWIDEGNGKRALTLSPTGRVLQEESPDGLVRSFEYNRRGELISAKSEGGTFRWTLDPGGRPLREEFEVNGATYVVDSQRNSAGDRGGFRTSLGHEIRFRRDPCGFPSELWDAQERVLAIHRTAIGTIEKEVFAKGGAIVNTRNGENMLVQRAVVAPSAPDASAGPIWVGRGSGNARTYEYTPADELRTISKTDGSSIEYEYDLRRRVTKETRSGVITAEFAPDATGNYHERGVFGTKARTYRADARDQLMGFGDVSYRYDARGNLIEKSRDRGDGSKPEVTRFEWNGWNLLQAVVQPDGTRIEFGYDAFARRLSKTTIRDDRVVDRHHYVWDMVSMVHAAKVDDDGKPTNVDTYLFRDNDHETPIGQRDAAGWSYYVADSNGATNEIVDGAGRVLARYERTLFGAMNRVEGNASTPFRFVGQQEDPETGLHYNRYRYYDPEVGRYISADPLGPDGGLNFYAYGPNPVSWVDPMGWKHWCTVTDISPPNAGGAPFNPGNTFGTPPGGNGWQFVSGITQPPGNTTPPGLDTGGTCHTEQKFAHHLINQYAPNGAQGRQFLLQGQLPPCPNCHAAMTRAAQETGAQVHYQWGTPPQSISYNGPGGSPQLTPQGTTFPGSTGGVANTPGTASMLGVYNQQDMNTPGTSTAGQYWGFTPAPGATNAYYANK